MKLKKMFGGIIFMTCVLGTSFALDSKLPPLHADGKNLRTQDGTLVNLRGTNVGGWLVQEFWMTPSSYTENVTCEADILNVLEKRFGKKTMEELIEIYQSAYFTEADFDQIASLGANCIRLPFWWRNLTDEKGKLKKNAFSRMDWFVENAAKRGMYVILDMHGAPGSQNGSDHSGVDGRDKKKETSEFFFGANAVKNQKIFYSLWIQLAKHYKGNSAVAGYDILNEPFCTYRYNSGLSDSDLHEMLWNIYDKTYKTIRKVDSDHLIIFEATWDPADLPNPSRYGWKNVMYEYHNYLYDDYDNAEGRQITNMQNKLNLIAFADYDVPSYMGEFAYFNNLDAWDKGLALLTDSGLNWTTWTYKTVDEYGNWGLVHHAHDVNGINLETISEQDLRKLWARAGEKEENKMLTTVFKKYAEKPATESDVNFVYDTSLATPPDGWTRYEGENAEVITGKTELQSFYSAGRAVGQMNTATQEANVASDWSNVRYVEFVVDADSEAEYVIRYAYNGNGADGMKILYKVNDDSNKVLLLNNAGSSWDKMNIAEFTVHLQAGKNHLRISGTIENQNNWANADYIDVRKK